MSSDEVEIGSETYSVTVTSGSFHVRQFVVAWEAKDVPKSTEPATTSLSSSNNSPLASVPLTSTPTATQPLPTATTAPPQPALSTGAKAGIAVGAILGALAVLLLTIGIIWRRRRRSRTIPPDPIEKPELPGEGIEHPQLASKTIYELPQQNKPHEAESRAAPVEMEGEWAGWEAPALVEVDMSRPSAAARNGDSEHHDRLQRLAKQSRVQG
ncbi:hypothetical protein PRZ48_009339 [Zasmidium cellare]|uniref:Uncharacterized protein n=1 Tax=Zasmidium cellare TaxID=395010 RepID=A0ABR0EBG1_ZASCE|nr:hypothetical protein PRZ48_009339 [Zasmidium cellare]